jgi:hypothetical protein
VQYVNLYYPSVAQVSCILHADGHDRILIMALVNDSEVAQPKRHVEKTMGEGE